MVIDLWQVNSKLRFQFLNPLLWLVVSKHALTSWNCGDVYYTKDSSELFLMTGDWINHCLISILTYLFLSSSTFQIQDSSKIARSTKKPWEYLQNSNSTVTTFNVYCYGFGLETWEERKKGRFKDQIVPNICRGTRSNENFIWPPNYIHSLFRRDRAFKIQRPLLQDCEQGSCGLTRWMPVFYFHS